MYLEPKRRRRTLTRRCCRTIKESERAARLGGKRKSLQLDIAQAWQPGDQSGNDSAAQHLLRGPKRIPGPLRLQHNELCEINTTGSERRRIGNVRRGEPNDALARRTEGGQGP